ncbi:MAG: glycine cleavage system protein GcvH [Deltaproteobacteria bacterium]|jgi:glycine cleavage system H protein|nr:glycine cleavage system protein GcvH [Deltaproteobacteria bacterium]
MQKNYIFTKSHEWFDPQTNKVGITAFAIEHIGDVVEVELPEEDEEIDKGDEAGTIESVKTASEIFCPVSGTIVEINEELEDSPELLNESPFDKGWLFKIEPSDAGEFSELMNIDEYSKFCAEEED